MESIREEAKKDKYMTILDECLEMERKIKELTPPVGQKRYKEIEALQKELVEKASNISRLMENRELVHLFSSFHLNKRRYPSKKHNSSILQENVSNLKRYGILCQKFIHKKNCHRQFFL